MQPNQNTGFCRQARFILAFFMSILVLSGCMDHDPAITPGSQTQSVYVIKIKDGDSLILRSRDSKEFEARLYGIDAPELAQPYGKKAKRALSELAWKQNFQMQLIETDKYDRAVVTLTNSSFNLNQEMLAKGHAWVYCQYQSDPDWIKLENKAKRSKKGLWKFPKPLSPWEWRQRNRKQLK